MRRTKIVATIGPASQAPAMLDALISAGVDVVRMNFSHGSHDFHRATMRNVREASARAGRPVAVLLDLQGPKIRIGKLPGGSVALTAGEELVIDCRAGADVSPGRVPCDYPGLPGDVKAGDPVLLDDGRLRLEVLAVAPAEVRCRVVEGGTLGERKGVNLPGSNVSLPSLSAKDRADLAFGVDELGVDLIALSFVRTAEDIAEAQALSKGVPVIAKIEKPQAVENLDAIIRQAQGCMVARGDLGVEYPLRKVPMIQKDIVEKTNLQGKLVIVATQMLETMIERSVPTRAEVSDIANAVFDGTDAVMLSAETASGRYPVEAVRTMAEILLEVEQSARYQALPPAALSRDVASVTSAVARAAAAAAHQVRATAIVVYTRSGQLARLLSDYRPVAPVIAYTPRREVLTQLPAAWGVSPRLAPEAYRTTEFMVEKISKELLARGDAKTGDHVIFVSATPPDRPGFGSSMMQVTKL